MFSRARIITAQAKPLIQSTSRFFADDAARLKRALVCLSFGNDKRAEELIVEYAKDNPAKKEMTDKLLAAIKQREKDELNSSTFPIQPKF